MARRGIYRVITRGWRNDQVGHGVVAFLQIKGPVLRCKSVEVVVI
jgi:hypothetical protein